MDQPGPSLLRKVIYWTVAMRIFNCKLDLVKSTERKLRWDENIDGTNFELYVPKWRVPEPMPPLISVRIFDASLIDTFSQLSPSQKAGLLKAGLSPEEVREIDSWLSIERTPKDRLGGRIFSGVVFF